MTEVFADSFYWIALLNPADAFHEAAQRTPVSGRIVTSLAVQMEVLDAFDIMRQRGITQALSADHHFRQAGLQTLFSSTDV